MASDIDAGDERRSDAYSLAPPEKLPPAALPQGADDASPESPGDAEDQQFSLTGLLVVMGLAGLIFAPARFLTPGTYAGFLGITAAVLLPIVSLLRARPIAHVAWWLLLGLYVAAMGYAMVQGPAH